MAKFTDTQLNILSAASQRDDRAVELPENVQGKAARKLVDKLIRPACSRRSAPVVRSRFGAAMITADRWRFASQGPASWRSMPLTRRRPRPRRQASALLPPAKSRQLPPKLSSPAIGFPLWHQSPPVRDVARIRRKPRLARSATTGRAPSPSSSRVKSSALGFRVAFCLPPRPRRQTCRSVRRPISKEPSPSLSHSQPAPHPRLWSPRSPKP